MSERRRGGISQAEAQRKLHARPTFNTVYDGMAIGVVSLEDPTRFNLLSGNRQFLREYYDAVLSTTTGNHSRMKRFRQRYAPNGKVSYDPGLDTFMGKIRASVLDPKPPKK